jgi:hypothetical protein
MIKSKRIIWARQVARIDEKQDVDVKARKKEDIRKS